MKPLQTLLISQLAAMLIFPAMLWAVTPCEEANDYVTEVEYLDSLIHRTLQKDLLQQALTLCPNHPEAHNHLAVILALENKNSEALYHFQQALKTRPDSPQAWFGIGELYYQQNQWPLSLAAYLQVCTRHQKARQRVAELLRDSRYRITDANRVLNYDSLILLYDKKRLQRLHQKVARCRNQDRSIAPDVNTVRAILQPIVVFQIIDFEEDEQDFTEVLNEQLDNMALIFTEMKVKHVIIRGYADNPAFSSKAKAARYRPWQKSQDRAKAVKTALSQRGIAEKRIKTYGYGDTRPVVRGHDEVAWVSNQRVEIEVRY
ncbi:MAG: hypothetical protein DRR16_05335 [Candidatus Parabeggiatoa sp. nov. 3]|nr:MAG: hypothetical protein DRR00_01330 [Gammaproteobacteria bacterium]RKZ88244.1 MAG: hypothetical protein DRR16_05335 [Gammaproteobacteria bacterium]HEW97156.1 tetratricopeptide repeat protein [Beggiatoa sp.]